MCSRVSILVLIKVTLYFFFFSSFYNIEKYQFSTVYNVLPYIAGEKKSRSRLFSLPNNIGGAKCVLLKTLMTEDGTNKYLIKTDLRNKCFMYTRVYYYDGILGAGE